MAGRMTSLTVITKDDAELAKHTFEMLCEIGAELSLTHHYASVSTLDPDETGGDESEDLYHDENTLVKVRKAIRSVVFNEDRITDIVIAMQNEGILFREKKS
jgi:hypothetical protein